MPTQNVSLPDYQADFIRERVQHGRYKNASEVVRAGLRLLEQQEAEDALKLGILRKAAQQGFDVIGRGEFETITPATIEDFMASVTAKPGSA